MGNSSLGRATFRHSLAVSKHLFPNLPQSHYWCSHSPCCRFRLNHLWGAGTAVSQCHWHFCIICFISIQHFAALPPANSFMRRVFHCIGSKQHKFFHCCASIFSRNILGLFSGYIGGGGKGQTNVLLPVQDSSVFLSDLVWFCLIGILFCWKVFFQRRWGHWYICVSLVETSRCFWIPEEGRQHGKFKLENFLTEQQLEKNWVVFRLAAKESFLIALSF